MTRQNKKIAHNGNFCYGNSIIDKNLVIKNLTVKIQLLKSSLLNLLLLNYSYPLFLSTTYCPYYDDLRHA